MPAGRRHPLRCAVPSVVSTLLGLELTRESDFVSEDQEVTYSEFGGRVAALASVLA